jgi:hypothetical protein
MHEYSYLPSLFLLGAKPPKGRKAESKAGRLDEHWLELHRIVGKSRCSARWRLQAGHCTNNSILGDISVCVFRTMGGGFEHAIIKTVGASLLAKASGQSTLC